jgi:hypothetical protein
MEQGQLNWIANFIWGIADDVLRDLYVRGKYRDVILPMTVLRRLDALLEPTKLSNEGQANFLRWCPDPENKRFIEECCVGRGHRKQQGRDLAHSRAKIRTESKLG